MYRPIKATNILFFVTSTSSVLFREEILINAKAKIDLAKFNFPDFHILVRIFRFRSLNVFLWSECIQWSNEKFNTATRHISTVHMLNTYKDTLKFRFDFQLSWTKQSATLVIRRALKSLNRQFFFHWPYLVCSFLTLEIEKSTS